MIMTTKKKKTTLMAMLAALLLLLLLLVVEPAASTERTCPRVPRFRVSQVEPLREGRGRVTLVALLSSSCSFCLEQSEEMEVLQQQLRANGTHVHMMIFNGGPRPAPGETGPLEQRVSFPVYHDDDRRTIWRRVFQGGKDDMFVIDRCGLIAYRIPFPYSYMGYSFVSRALNRAHTRNVCSNCQSSPDCPNCRLPDPHDQMMGDAPASDHLQGNRPGRSRISGRIRGAGSGSLRRAFNRHRSINRSRCPKNDRLCRELRNARRRYNRYRHRHGIRLSPYMREEEILGVFQRSQRGGIRGPAF